MIFFVLTKLKWLIKYANDNTKKNQFNNDLVLKLIKKNVIKSEKIILYKRYSASGNLRQ